MKKYFISLLIMFMVITSFNSATIIKAQDDYPAESDTQINNENTNNSENSDEYVSEEDTLLIEEINDVINTTNSNETDDNVLQTETEEENLQSTGTPDYLKFSAQEAGATVTLNKEGSPYSISLQTSTDGNTWSNYTVGTAITLTNKNDYVYFRATTTNTAFSKDSSNYYYFSMSNKIAASGNIMSLLDSTCTSKTLSSNYVFYKLFNNCSSLTSVCSLPATILTNGCYQSMFGGCTSLVSAPELPAETLRDNCYNSMFYGCTSLTKAPALPATTLAGACYNSMFRGCTALVNAPELPATTLANWCYNYMFYGCTNIKVHEKAENENTDNRTTITIPSDVGSLKSPVDNMFTNTGGSFKGTPVAGKVYVFDKLNYIKFTAQEAGATIKLNKFGTPNSISLQTSTDGNTWSNYTVGNTITLANAGDYVCFKATSNNTTISKDKSNYYYFSMSKKIAASGNIMSLLDSTGESKTLSSSYVFYKLFNDCKTLTSVCSLPATTLTNGCYQSMFGSCTSLVSAPELPATTLAGDCYNSMFYGCTSLTKAPALPATTLAGACYNSMFRGCTALVNAPELPAKNLTSWCYNYMFAECTNLTVISELNITSLANSSCNSMFDGCTNLKVHEKAENENTDNRITTTIPSDIGSLTTPVTNMFNATGGSFKGTPAAGKTYVYDIPDYLKFTAQEAGATITLNKKGTPNSISLETSTDGNTWSTYNVGSTITLTNKNDYVYFKAAATNTAFSKDSSNYYYFSMSKKIAASGNIMSLLDSICASKTISKSYTFNQLFEGCKTLTSAPELPAESLASACYRAMFNGCSALVSVPALPAKVMRDYCYKYMFSNCTGLVNAPELPAGTLAVYCYQYMFSGCTALVTAPDLPAKTLTSNCYNFMFSGCTGLKNAPVISATVMAESCCQSMFAGCTSLVSAPVLSAKTLASNCYNSMFSGCTSLVNAPELPATTLAVACYNSMFSGCTGLVSFIELPATTLANWCYNCMFSDCTNLKVHEKAVNENTDNRTIIVIPSGIGSLTSPVDNMFTDTSGSFKGTPAAGKTYVLDGSIELTADKNNINPTYGFAGNLKYVIKTTNFKTNPTTESISLTCYSDSALKNKIDNVPFTHSVSGTTLTISSKTTTEKGDYYVVVSEGNVSASSIKITVADYLKFTAQEAGATITLNKEGSPNSISLQKSTDGKTWSTYNVGSTVTLTNKNDYVYFKATTTNTAFTKDSSNYYHFSMSKKIAASGNIMSLLDGTCTSKTISKNYTFNQLFENCKTLTSAPELPAETLQAACYRAMFNGCTALVSAPALPAKVMKDYCYKYMFSGCTSLVNAPELPAGTLAIYCYQYMFNGCTGLSDAPDLPAKTLTNNCYQNMFAGCTGLKNAPVISATTMAELCCQYMFSGCTALVNAPELPALTLASSCYQYMFNGCTGLVTAPVLPAKTLTNSCYNFMFSGCTGLVNAPVISATVLAEACCQSMFAGCTSLVSAPVLSAKTLASNCYNSMFNGCSSLINAPELPATTLQEACYNSMFKNCTSLTTAPELPATTLANWCYNYMFAGCTNLKVHEKAENENTDNRTTITVPSDIGSLSSPVNNMFTETGGSFKGTPAAGKTYVYDIPDYLKFTAQEAGATITLNKQGSPNSISLETSTDGKNWTAYNVGSTVTLASKNDYVYFRASAADAVFSKDGSNYYHFSMSKKIAASGNIMSLLDVTCISKTISRNYTFNQLFEGCKTLISAPELPAETLQAACYRAMFNGCSGLVSAPELPAKVMEDYCYKYMFSGCTGLKNAPALPAETLAIYCYQYMFNGCTGLVTAPDLPAKTLTNNCYYFMFAGCTSLKNAPVISATVMAESCCQSMFAGCTSLVTAPVLSAKTLAGNCYNSMFSGCTSLTDAPELPATTLADACYNSMFKDCTALTTAPELPATTLTGWCYNYMFAGCTNLKVHEKTENENTDNRTTITVPSDIGSLSSPVNNMFTDTSGSFKGTPSAGKTYVFDEPDYLKFTAQEAGATITLNKQGSPNGISLETSADGKNWTAYNVGSTLTLANKNDYVYFRSTVANGTFSKDYSNYYHFSMSKKIAASGNIMSLLDRAYTSKTISKYYTFNQLFEDCKTLTSAPELPATTLASACYRAMFNGCTGLTSAPALPATVMKEYCYRYMFSGCTGLTSAPELSAGTLASYCYQYMFSGCTGLVTAPDLPAKTLTNNCYNFMFSGCTKLKNAPVISATTMAESCCQSMFAGCTSLVTAPVLSAKTLASDCYNSMFSGCSGLTSAPELPATTLAVACYNSMFKDCTGLTTAPELPAETLTAYCYNFMFAGCTNLTSISELKITSLANSSCNSMFAGCTKLKVHEKADGENANSNKIEISIPGLTGLTNPVTDMFKGTGGSFAGTPAAEKTYVLDASIELTADGNNENPEYGTVGSLKYTINAVNFKNNPTTTSISLTCYSDSALKNKIDNVPFTYSVSGTTLTISSKTATEKGDYYVVVSDDVKADTVMITVTDVHVASITSDKGVTRKYITLKAALSEVKANQTIVMISDSDESLTSLIVDKNITIDLNGTNLTVKSMNVLESDTDNCHPLIIDTAADDKKGSLSFTLDSGFVYDKKLAKTESTDTTIRYIPVCVGENTYQFNEVLVGTSNKTVLSKYWVEGDQAFVGAYLRDDLDVPTILAEGSGVGMGLKIKFGKKTKEMTFASTTTSEYITKYTHAKPYFHIKGIEDVDYITVNGYVTQKNGSIDYRFDGISRDITLVK